jgi:CheY-like chemotaxis protein
MPDLDVYAVARQLRSDMPDVRMHVIAVTGYGQKKTSSARTRLGLTAHLLKPVGSMELDAVLARYAASHQKAGGEQRAAVLRSTDSL